VVSEPASTLIAQVQLEDEPFPRRRLFCRVFDGRTYSELVPHQDHVDDGDPTPCPVSPVMYFKRDIWTGAGGEWSGLYRVHLQSRRLTCILGEDSLAGGWISQILGVSGDGERLFVKVGSVLEVPTGPARYGVAALDLKTMRIAPLADLPAGFL